MAGASDPLEDMLFNEVDEKAVSDLVGSLESQLGDRQAPAAPLPGGKREAAGGHFSGKERDPAEPQQGHPRAGSEQEPAAKEPLAGTSLPSSTSSAGAPASGAPPSAAPPTGAAPVAAPAPVTLSAPPAASFLRAPSASAGIQSLNGAAAAKLANSASAGAPAPGSSAAPVPAPQPPAAAPGPPGTPSPAPGAAQNGVEPKSGPQGAPSSAGPQGVPSSAAPQVQNHSGPVIQAKVLVPGVQPAGPGVPPGQPAVAQGEAAAVNPAPGGVKPVVNGVGQPTVTVVRPPAPQQQRPGLVATAARPAAPQPPLAVRPQQQTTIQLPPGFTIPAGMVLVQMETGQLVMVPQQVLAQAQAKNQQGQTVANISQRPAGPAAGPTIRVSAASPAPGAPQTLRLAPPPQTRLAPPSAASPVQKTMVPGGAAVSVKMAPQQNVQTVITAGGVPMSKPGPMAPSPAVTSTPPAAAAAATPPATVTIMSQEMQENVKKCKNFLATLIKLTSDKSPSPYSSKNVKALVQDLLDAKIEPEEFTTRVQVELKSLPQPYLIPFLKKSLPALRLSLHNSQQSLTTAPPAPPPVLTPRPPLPISPAGGAVRLNAPLANTGALAGGRGVQTLQTRSPVVIGQGLRPQGAFVRGPATIIGKTPINVVANQKKLSDPGGGTFRDDDDINDVASMAGVNLNEENARILATSSELVGTKIRSCKDESFLPAGLLHRRILDTARKLGVTEVPPDVVAFISHATQSRLRSLLEKVSILAQHRTDAAKDEDHQEQTSDVRSQLRFFEQLERMEKQRKDEQEREILLKAAKSRARQEDPEQARLKQKAKEMQQQELAQMRQRDANLTALAAIGPRKKRKLDSPGGAGGGAEVASGSGAGSSPGASRQQLRQRITRVNLRDFIFCLEQDRSTARSLALYRALLK